MNWRKIFCLIGHDYQIVDSTTKLNGTLIAKLKCSNCNQLSEMTLTREEMENGKV